ncbi:MAG: T9SS type A sorting domain-containing protein [Flavobacteriales bacterium]
MKHIFSFLAVAALGMGAAFGQCDADFDFMGAEFGISPNPLLGETFVEGEVNQPYVDVIHVIIPASTAGIPDAPIELPLDSVVLDSILLIGAMGEALLTSDIGLSMYPNNNGDLPNPNAFLGGNQYCASLEGTPDTVGVFTGAIYTTAWVTVPFLGANAIPFPFEGYTLTINEPAVPGCMDDMACNYNPEANEDDGSCVYANPGLDCDGNCLLDADGDGICDPVLGCTDAMACNYDASATEDDMSCEYAADYYDCEGMCLMDTDGDGVCDELEVAGCTDMTACNYNEMATDDDGSCTFAVDFYDCDGNCLNDEDMDGVCDELEVAGCTSPYACNYDELATDDDGSCTVVGDSCDDGNDMTENDMIDENCECMGTEIVDRVDEFTQWDIALFPTPVSDVMHIRFNGQASGLTALTLTNAAGQNLHTQQLLGNTSLDVSRFPQGIYFVTLRGDWGTATRRVLLGGR